MIKLGYSEDSTSLKCEPMNKPKSNSPVTCWWLEESTSLGPSVWWARGPQGVAVAILGHPAEPLGAWWWGNDGENVGKMMVFACFCSCSHMFTMCSHVLQELKCIIFHTAWWSSFAGPYYEVTYWEHDKPVDGMAMGDHILDSHCERCAGFDHPADKPVELGNCTIFRDKSPRCPRSLRALRLGSRVDRGLWWIELDPLGSKLPLGADWNLSWTWIDQWTCGLFFGRENGDALFHTFSVSPYFAIKYYKLWGVPWFSLKFSQKPTWT